MESARLVLSQRGEAAAFARGGPDLVARPAPAARSRWGRAAGWLAVAMLGAVAGGAATLVNPRDYAAHGLLIGLDGGTPDGERAVAGSEAVIRSVAAQIGPGRLLTHPGRPAWLARWLAACPARRTPAACAAEAVRSRLQITVAGAGQMLQITARHPDPAVAVAMVDAASTADRDLWREIHAVDHAAPLAGPLAGAERDAAEGRAAAASIRARARVGDIAQDMAEALAARAEIARARSRIQTRQAQIDAELAVDRAALQAAPAMVAESREVSSGAGAQDSRALLLQLKLDRAHMAQLYAPDYPGLAELGSKIATVEAAARAQARNPVSVSREGRNPVLDVLSAQVTALEAERASAAGQDEALERQASAAAAREAAVREAEALLADLRQAQALREAVVGKLTLDMAKLRAEDAIRLAGFDQRRLLEPPVAGPAPWTGLPGGIAAGALASLAGAVVVLRGGGRVGRRSSARPSFAAARVRFGVAITIANAPFAVDRPAGRLAESLASGGMIRSYPGQRIRPVPDPADAPDA